jgi:hypothetical protein
LPKAVVPCGGRLDPQGYNPMAGPWRDAWCGLPEGHAGPHDFRHPDGSRVEVASMPQDEREPTTPAE